MTRFLNWRKMTWAIWVWGALIIALWIVAGSFMLALLVGMLGLILLGFLWWMTRPLWRHGHRARLRRLRSVPGGGVPSKPVENSTSLPG
jgi:O-antigen/teichoic acid export membrane protein